MTAASLSVPTQLPVTHDNHQEKESSVFYAGLEVVWCPHRSINQAILAANPFPYIQMIRGQTQVFYKKKTPYNMHRHNLHHNQSPLPSLLQWSESPQVRRNYGVIPAIILPFCYKNDEWSPATQRSVFSRYLLSTLILNIRIRNTTH